jgi:hypothetical protein
MSDAEIIHELLWYLFNKVPLPDADLHSDLEDGSEECERVDELFWRVLKDIEKVYTIEQIEETIKGLSK